MGLIVKIAQYLVSILGFQVAQSAISKAILIGCFTLILPVVLNNVFYALIEKIMSFASDNVSIADGETFVYQFTGLGAYIADNMYLPTCISILLSAVALRFSLRIIRVI